MNSLEDIRADSETKGHLSIHTNGKNLANISKDRNLLRGYGLPVRMKRAVGKPDF